MPEPPNILLLFSDQHRWDWLGRLGHVPVRTPNLDRLAARGMLFHQCRVASPMCGPSRACLATGRRYHNNGVPNNRYQLDPMVPTFMKALRQVGYRVMSCGKSDLHDRKGIRGITGWNTRMGQLGFTHTVETAGKRGNFAGSWPTPTEPYMAYMHTQGLARAPIDDLARREEIRHSGGGNCAKPGPFSREHQIDDFVGRTAKSMLDATPTGGPWFLQVNMGSPHPPFDASPELLARYDGVDFPGPHAPLEGDPNDHQAVRRNYAAQIEGMDEWFGWILDHIEQRGELDNTVVVYASDHGEALGDVGRWGKGKPCEASVHVPLIVAGPGVQQGVESQVLVELQDLAATFADLAEAEPVAKADALSLRPVLTGDADSHRPYSFTADDPWRLVTDGHWKLIVWSNERSPELYDLVNDPHEQHNVIADHPDRVEQMQGWLDEASVLAEV